jgi:uncharacterized protein
LLTIAHFGLETTNKIVTTIAAIDLIICALSAWYMMFANIMNDLSGKILIPFGKPWIKKKEA